MGAIIEAHEFDGAEFFAPSPTDFVDGLIGQYRLARKRIARVAEFIAEPECSSVIDYFLEGNATTDRGRIALSASAAQLFKESGAVAALNSAYWSKAMSLTDVYDAMPQARREEWNKSIREMTAPEFEEETVRATLLDLLNSRARFMAERVDGIFRALSGEHVTNSPAAFGKRMIIANLVTSYGTAAWERVGYINDLRCVIAKFMGREEPKWDASSVVVQRARREMRGQWVTLDGGALRLRAYKCGTAHLEVHPDMAWRLNCVLANLYPMAIPPEFRAKPKKKPKDFVMMGRPLPFAVVAVLEGMKTAFRLEKSTDWRREYNRIEIRNTLASEYGHAESSPARQEAERVLAYIGGVKVQGEAGGTYFEFDYDPREVVAEIVCTGCLPDQKAHQFYPTPANVAEAAIELAQIGPADVCLEPSAGTGGLADLMPKERTRCVEISKLHCNILSAKGFPMVSCCDFLEWSKASGPSYNRVVMNPPFSEGRWQAHLESAAGLLASSGRLVAILPASAKGKDVLLGWTLEWSAVFANEFAGTSTNVVILCARRGP